MVFMPGRVLPHCFLMGGTTLPWTCPGSRPALAAGTSLLQDLMTSARLGCLLRYDRLYGTEKPAIGPAFSCFLNFNIAIKVDIY